MTSAFAFLTCARMYADQYSSVETPGWRPRLRNARYARCTRKNMVNMHKVKSTEPRYQMGKVGFNTNTTPMTRARERVRMPQRTNLFPGWDLKISQNT